MGIRKEVGARALLRQDCPKVLSMAERDDADELSWPWWAPWALLAVAVTSVLTIGATLYDIL